MVSSEALPCDCVRGSHESWGALRACRQAREWTTATSSSQSYYSPAWALPMVEFACPGCAAAMVMPDLRREPEERYRARCASCGTSANKEYKDALRRLDARELVRLPCACACPACHSKLAHCDRSSEEFQCAVPVFVKVQLFLIECAGFANGAGRVHSRRLTEGHVLAYKALLKTCLKYGLLEEDAPRRYVITGRGAWLLAVARQRYGVEGVVVSEQVPVAQVEYRAFQPRG